MDRNCWLLQSTDGSMDDKDMEVYSQKSFELCQPPEPSSRHTQSTLAAVWWTGHC